MTERDKDEEIGMLYSRLGKMVAELGYTRDVMGELLQYLRDNSGRELQYCAAFQKADRLMRRYEYLETDVPK